MSEQLRLSEYHTHAQKQYVRMFCSYLSHHPIPNIVNLLPMLAIGYQVQVIGEPDILCNLLQNIYAEAFAAFLDVCPTSLCCVTSKTQTKHIRG